MIFVRLAISRYLRLLREYTIILLTSHIMTKLLAVIKRSMLLSIKIFLMRYVIHGSCWLLFLNDIVEIYLYELYYNLLHDWLGSLTLQHLNLERFVGLSACLQPKLILPTDVFVRRLHAFRVHMRILTNSQLRFQRLEVILQRLWISINIPSNTTINLVVVVVRLLRPTDSPGSWCLVGCWVGRAAMHDHWARKSFASPWQFVFGGCRHPKFRHESFWVRPTSTSSSPTWSGEWGPHY